eukprot:Rmarinus@m.25007
MEGFLYKAGVKNKAFKNRYFRLKGTQLSYYRSEKDGNPAGVVDLNGCVIKDHDAGKFEACICLYHPERNIVHDHTELILGTYARREMERWKKELASATGAAPASRPVSHAVSDMHLNTHRDQMKQSEDWGKLDPSNKRATAPRGFTKGVDFGSEAADGVDPQARAQQLEDDSKQTLHRSLQITEEIKKTGAGALTQLHAQTDQIENIQDQVANIHGNLHRGDRLLRGIESVTGSIKNKFSRSRADEVKADLMSERQGSGSKHSPRSADGSPRSAAAMKNSSELTEDEGLDLISGALKDLKGMGLQIGQEVDHQAQLLDRLDTDIDLAATKIQEQNKRMKKILN